MKISRHTIDLKKTLLASSVAMALQATTLQAQILEEVVVTAQKRAQSVNDVSIAMVAIGSDELKSMRIESAQDIANIVPNVDIKNTLGGVNPAITVRGVGLNDFNANNSPSVGIYVDEVFLSSPGMLSFTSFDTERVEVLKGPQGTLYGRNSNGGAINFHSTKPSYETEGYVIVGAGNYKTAEVEGAVGGALGERVAGRVSGKYTSQGETYMTNTATGEDFGDSNMYSVRGQLAFDPSDSVQINFATTFGHQEQAFQAYKNRGFFDINGNFETDICPTAVTGNPDQTDFSCVSGVFAANEFAGDVEAFPDQDRYQAHYEIDTPKTEVDSNLSVLRIDWDINDTLALTAVTGYASIDREYADSVFGSLQGYHYFDSNRKDEVSQFSQEIRISSEGDSVKWIAGAFYSADNVEASTLINATDTLATFYDVSYDQDTTTAAAFFNIDWMLTDTLSVIGGIRYTSEKLEYKGGTTDLNPYGASLILILSDIPTVDEDGEPIVYSLTADTDISQSSNNTSGKIGLEYRPNNDWLLYGTVSTGYKSGIVFSDITFAPEEQGPLEPEEIISYEAGFKGTLADGAAQFNGAAFYYDYKDIQTLVPSEFGLFFTNAEKATIKGLELDVAWTPTEGLMLRGSVGWLDSEMNDPALDGNDLPNAARLQYTGVARYDFPVSDGLRIALQTDFKYSDGVFREATNDPLAASDDATIVNARASLLSANEDWNVSIWGKNLTDEAVLEQSFIVGFFGITGDLYSPPRTYGISVNYRF